MDSGREKTVTDDALNKLQLDVKEWQRVGIITDDQAVAIVGYYADHAPASRRQVYARMSTMLALMGAVLVGVGILLFVAANWQGIPLIMRFVLLCTTVIACNGIGYFLLYSRGYGRLGEAVFLLGGIAFGAGIFLAAQAYSYDVETSVLLFWWSAGVVPLAYILRLQSLLYLGLFLFLVAFIWFMATRGGDMESATVFIAMMTALGSSLFAAGTLHRLVRGSISRFSWIYAGFGTGILIVALYILSFEEFLENDFLDTVNENYWGNFVTVAFFSLLALLCWIPDLVSRKRKISSVRLPVLDLATIPGGIVVAVSAYWSGLVGNSVIMAAVFNVLLIVAIIAILVAGVVERRGYFINLSLFFFGLLIFTRYVDLMWGMLDGALLFITSGLLMLLLGFFLERTRRRLTMELTSGDWQNE